MDKRNVIVMTIEDYNDLLIDASDNTLEIRDEGGEWFYINTDGCEYEDDKIIDMLNKELNEDVLDVIVDITEDKVAIVCM